MPTDTIPTPRVRFTPLMARAIAETVPPHVNLAMCSAAEQSMYAVLSSRRYVALLDAAWEATRMRPSLSMAHRIMPTQPHPLIPTDLVGLTLPVPSEFHVPLSNDMNDVD